MLERRPLKGGDYSAWRNTTREILIKCFGSDSGNVRSFSAVGTVGSFLMNASEREYEEQRAELLEKQLSLLESCRELLEIESESGSDHPDVSTSPEVRGMRDQRSVFLVHGQNKKAAQAMEAFLRAVGLSPIDFDALSANMGGSPFIGDVVRKGMEDAQAVVVLFTPDEYAALRNSLRRPDQKGEEIQRWQARPNVIFEAGMALGQDPRRTILVTLGSDVSLFSDVQGRHLVRFTTGTAAERKRLLDRLRGAQCLVSEAGTSWLESGDFANCDGAEEVPHDPFDEQG